MQYIKIRINKYNVHKAVYLPNIVLLSAFLNQSLTGPSEPNI